MQVSSSCSKQRYCFRTNYKMAVGGPLFGSTTARSTSKVNQSVLEVVDEMCGISLYK